MKIQNPLKFLQLYNGLRIAGIKYAIKEIENQFLLIDKFSNKNFGNLFLQA